MEKKTPLEDPESDIGPDRTVTTLNFGALTAHYLLTNNDEFKDVYHMLRDVAYKMTDNVKKYVYATNLMKTALDQEPIIRNSVLINITDSKKRDEIVADQTYGFSTTEMIVRWVEAVA